MNRNLVVLAVVIAAVALMLFGGQYLARRSGDQAAAPGSSIGGGEVAGKPAPNFELTDMQGNKHTLEGLRGKAVLLNFWATWCGPCKVEMPWFVEFQKKYGEQGLQVVGVAMDDSGKEEIQKFANDMGVNYLIVQGTNAVGDAYGGVLGLPTTFYIDRNGLLVDRHIGLASKSDIEEKIKKSLESVAHDAHTGAHDGHGAASPEADPHAGHDAKADPKADEHKGHDQKAEPQKK